MNHDPKTRLMLILNWVRTLPVYWCYLKSRQRRRIDMDLEVWAPWNRLEGCSPMTQLNYLLSCKPEFRNLLLHRFRNPEGSHLHYYIARLFWKPLDSLYLETRDIGGGLYIQHGFATIVDAESIGEYCWINQQVTIGYTEKGHPILEDHVSVNCGAKVLGNVTMHRGSTAGAGAVVVKDVPENAVVGGVPAKVIKWKHTSEESEIYCIPPHL